MPRPPFDFSALRSSAEADARLSAPERFMALALEQAALGVGRTHPNPPVGAVVVKDGEVVGRGFHRKAGAAHAEVEALAEAGEHAEGADLYVTLEPCSHHGRTPPCTEAILRARVQRVFVGTIDPNPLVSGQGVRRLEAAGLEVRTGVFASACDDLIRGFARFIRTGRPYVVVKAGMTLDGKIATSTGASKWITGTESRLAVHRLRDELDAVLVGAGTVVADDPALDVRLDAPVYPGRPLRDPVRVVLDGRLESPADARVFDGTRGDVFVLTAEQDADKARAYEARGATVVALEGRDGVLEPEVFLRALGHRGLTTLLVEGGSRVHGALLRSGLVDEIRLFVAPLVFGADGLSWAASLGVRTPDDAPAFRLAGVEMTGQDLLVILRPREDGEEN